MRKPYQDLAPPPTNREGKATRVKLSRRVYFGGQLREAGEVITVTEFEALDLKALGRAELA